MKKNTVPSSEFQVSSLKPEIRNSKPKTSTRRCANSSSLSWPRKLGIDKEGRQGKFISCWQCRDFADGADVCTITGEQIEHAVTGPYGKQCHWPDEKGTRR